MRRIAAGRTRPCGRPPLLDPILALTSSILKARVSKWSTRVAHRSHFLSASRSAQFSADALMDDHPAASCPRPFIDDAGGVSRDASQAEPLAIKQF